MNEHVEIISHNGKKIYVSDYSGLQEDDLRVTVARHAQEHLANVRKGDNQMLFYVDISNTRVNRDVVKLFMDLTKSLKPYTKKSAVVGVTGMQKMLLNAINACSSLENRPFDTKESALTWLADD